MNGNGGDHAHPAIFTARSYNGSHSSTVICFVWQPNNRLQLMFLRRRLHLYFTPSHTLHSGLWKSHETTSVSIETENNTLVKEGNKCLQQPNRSCKSLSGPFFCDRKVDMSPGAVITPIFFILAECRSIAKSVILMKIWHKPVNVIQVRNAKRQE